MKGKLLLLVADKLFVGAVLALAFVVYDNWKTAELRAYNEIIQRYQNELRKVEFVKELLPIVLDKKQDIYTRIEMLGGLIQTKSIESQAAFEIALSLLREGNFILEDKLAEGTFSDDSIAQNFARILAPIIPDVLPRVLTAYYFYDESPNIAPPGYSQTLEEVFEYAWAHISEEKLWVLNSKWFVGENLPALLSITPHKRLQYKLWETTSLLALQILHDLSVLQNERAETSVVQRARTRLAGLINVRSDDADSVNLSSRLFEVLVEWHIVEDEFVQAAFDVIVQPEKVADVFGDLILEEKESRDPYEQQFYSARQYLMLTSNVNALAEALAIPIVRNLTDALSRGEITRSTESGDHRIEKAAVCVLVGSVSGINTGGTEESEKLLGELASLSKQELSDLNLTLLIDWKSGTDGELTAMCFCGILDWQYCSGD